MSGVIHLAEEVRDARAAGRKLANVDSDLVEDDIVGVVIKLREEVAGFRLDNKRAVKKMDQTLYEMRNLVDRVEELYNSAKDETHSAEQAALNGVNKAQEKAQEITLRNIDEATQRSKKAIDTMVLESKRRIERLAMVTLPDRMFHFLKWTRSCSCCSSWFISSGRCLIRRGMERGTVISRIRKLRTQAGRRA